MGCNENPKSSKELRGKSVTLYVSFNNVDRNTAIQLKKWTFMWNNEKVYAMENAFPEERMTHIMFVQINKAFDWLKVHRLKKRFDCYFIVILDEDLLHTSPLAINLKVNDLLINPVKKTHFFRSIRKISLLMAEANSLEERNSLQAFQNGGTISPKNEQVETYYLRQMMKEKGLSEQDLIKALTYFEKDLFPNVVCFIQGFIHPDKIEETKNNAVQFIKNTFHDLLGPIIGKLYFLPFHNYSLILFRLPEEVTFISKWKKGHALFHLLIKKLLENHHIQITLGVGTSYSNPELLHHSFQEARKARSTPPYRDTHLRYYEELSVDPQILKCTKFITSHLEQELSAQDVANHVNLSYTYFCRTFKKETGKSFSEYVAYARLQQAVWMLRHTNNTIEEISDYVGFNTPNYFSAIFKKFVYLTPSEYRQTEEIKFI